jgi:hypothetical protein
MTKWSDISVFVIFDDDIVPRDWGFLTKFVRKKGRFPERKAAN